jgi:hypothetical protein
MHAYQSWHNRMHIIQLHVCYELLKYVHTVKSLNTVTPHSNQVCWQITCPE